MVAFLVCSNKMFKEKSIILNQFLKNPTILRQFLVVIACYFTYLSSMTYRRRKVELAKWICLPEVGELERQISEGMRK